MGWMENETGWDAVKCCNINLTGDRSPPGVKAGRQDEEGKGRRGQGKASICFFFFPLFPGSFTQSRRMDEKEERASSTN